ncbi:MAG: chorismate mutase [Bacillales bacterium]|jgi:chorismate mutase|nr:chorismate mutase [Bacillales bacterium]
MKSIEKLREKIDIIDNKIVELLNLRLDVIRDVVIYKKVNNLSVEDKAREKDIIERIKKLTNDPEIINIYEAIIEECKNFQKKHV